MQKKYVLKNKASKLLTFGALTLSLFLVQGCDLTENYLKAEREGSLEVQDYKDAMASRVTDSVDPESTSKVSIPELQPYIASSANNLKPMPLVSLSVNQSVPLKDILFELAKQADYDLELDPNIRGSIIFTARNRPFDKVVERISDIAGLRYSFEDDVLRVEVDTPYNKLYKVDYLSYIRKTSGGIRNDVNVVSGEGSDTGSNFEATSESEIDFWAEMETNLNQIVGGQSTGALKTNTDPQITVAETVGVGGRGSYYDKSGAMRDMVQNHLMQLLCLIAMEPPNEFEPDAVRDEKLKVIRALDPVSPSDIVRGQYRGGEGQSGYLEDVEDPSSKTESFVALKVGISNWRWKGTPFYLRTGKRLRARTSEIAVVFNDPPHSIFEAQEERRGNVLAIRLQPNEGITMRVTIKEPGPGGMRLVEVPLDMTFADALGPGAEDVPDAYERLIMDVIRGNQTLFMRGDEVEAAWAWTDPIIAGWEARGDTPRSYDSGGSGPEDSLMLLHRDGRRWREVRA